ncbi:MAG TPA: Verru_Chthon cassette protein A, partial [Candidatus Methylacidiphilales bacterium]|nr:Verru_Chthon cassette protein A [Candidatus Methylacidiphilales bacterium]
FTDLNSPVIRYDAASGTKTVQFPVVDPRARTQADATSVAGFNYQSGSVNGVVLPGSTADDQRLPMPVRWLYVLADGTMASPDDSTSGTVTFASGAPSEANPVIGRIAFWTDDETSKVNINTASEGIYYDLPRYAGPPEYVLSMYAPVLGEFQRYPGHPATTCLSAVFRPWLPSPNDIKPVYDLANTPAGLTSPSPRLNSATSSTMQTRLESYLNLAPRVRFGGSKGGTDLTAVKSDGTIAKVAGKADRLYGSIDELLYGPTMPATERTASNPVVDKAVLERTRFFLTANNRAPEVNLFGTPRVSIWPISKNIGATYRTTQDTLIAFCSTLGSSTSPTTQYPFYFQRGNPRSATDDYTKIPRNIALYSYLQNITSRRIPGFGGSFTAKYGNTERDQILTEMFDYIRSCNLNDPNVPTTGTYTDSFTLGGGFGQQPFTAPHRSPGLVVPIRIGTTKGSGRYPVIDQAFLIFYTTEMPDISRTVGSTKPELTETKFRAALFFNFFHPMQGFMVGFTNLQLDVTSSGQFRCEPIPDADPGKSASLVSADPSFSFFSGGNSVTQWANSNERVGGQQNNRNFGGNHSHVALLYHAISETDPRKKFNMASKNIITLRGDPLKAKWNFRGGSFKVRVGTDPYPLTGAGETVQTYEFEFPDSLNMPIPTPGSMADSSGNYFSTAGDLEVNSRGYPRGSSNPNGFFMISRRVDPGNIKQTLDGGDVIRTVQLADKASDGTYPGGDIRRLSFTAEVPKTWYVKHKNYDSGTYKAHSLRDGIGSELPDSTPSGSLVKGITYENNLNPYVRSEINGVYASKNGSITDAPGDWNNGLGITPDGPYLNRADEGVNYDPVNGGGEPYFEWTGVPQNKNLTSPNKQLPSAGMFGSLLTGTTRGYSWQTLLFRPDSTGKHSGRAGFNIDGTSNPEAPADFLWLDLFHMPIVEPYAISEPFSTAGKINMNSQLMPFTYITRDTGIWAVLMAERILAIPSTNPSPYRRNSKKLTNPDCRYPINIPETLKGFQERFASGDIFRSASEICSLDIIPNDTKDANARYGSMAAYWNSHLLSGDNAKERPYTTIYPRITTKSNTYTVHFIAQALKKTRGTQEDVWVEDRDQVSGEYRGSAMIERYVDPSDPRVPDFAIAPEKTIETYYRWRINTTKRFAP